jgi:hypothetical protein
MNEIKNDIWHVIKDAMPLETTGWVTCEKGEIVHNFPTDMQTLKAAKLLYGVNTGTAQTAATGTITLAAAFSSPGDWMYGKPIYIYSGTGSEQARICVGWDNTTKVATITPNWTTTPSGTILYMVVDTYYSLDVIPEWDYDKESYPMNRSRPISLSPIGDDDDGEFKLLNAPDDTYGIELRYFLNLMEVDITSQRMTTLYSRWRNCFTYGIYAKCLEWDDDDRAPAAASAYNNYLNGIAMRERYGLDLSGLQQTVEDW